MNGSIKIILGVIAFFFFLTLIILGQKNIGYTGLAMEFIGLAGLLCMLYRYNRKYK